MLRESEQKFKELTEKTTDWVWEVDKDGVYIYANPKVKELLGYEVSEILGKTPFDFMLKEEVEKIGKFFRKKVIKKEPFYGLENMNRHKDGHLVILETNGIPLFDEKGRLKGYRGIDRDITERKLAEEALNKSHTELKKANLKLKKIDLRKSEFLSNVSHALRTPLTSIKSFTQILLKYKNEDPAKQREFLAIIDNETDHLTRLINRLLDLDKIEHGELEWKFMPCNISNIIQTSIDETKPLIREKTLQLI